MMSLINECHLLDVAIAILNVNSRIIPGNNVCIASEAYNYNISKTSL